MLDPKQASNQPSNQQADFILLVDNLRAILFLKMPAWSILTETGQHGIFQCVSAFLGAALGSQRLNVISMHFVDRCPSTSAAVSKPLGLGFSSGTLQGSNPSVQNRLTCNKQDLGVQVQI